MGIESDQEIIQMIGIEEEVMNYFAATIEEGNMLQIYTKVQVDNHLCDCCRFVENVYIFSLYYLF